MERRGTTAAYEVDDLIGALVDLVSGVRLSEVLSQVVRTACGLLDACDGLLAVVDADDTVVEVVKLEDASPSVGLPARIQDAGALRSPSERWALSDRSVDDRPTHSQASALKVLLRSRRGFRAHLYVANRRRGEDFIEADAALLASFASIAGAVIDKAQLYEEAQQRELWVALQGEIATSLLAGVHIDHVMDSVARGARELMDADVSTVLLHDGASSLKLCAADGHGIRHIVGESLPMEDTISGGIIRTGESVMLSDVSSHAAVAEPLLSLGAIGRALFVPLESNVGTVGTLAVGRLTGSRPLTQTDFWLLESFASQVSVALEYGRARRELEQLAVVEDQERIARDLHDTVIQQLFATGMSLQATARRATDSKTAERIQAAVDGLDRIIRDIRAAVFALNTTARDTGGIPGELHDIVADMFESSDLTVDIRFDGPIETAIDDEIRRHVIATVREALANVSRHAQADRVDVLVSGGSELVVRVVDDGVGIGKLGGHMGGLLNLKARAESLGGTMSLSQPAAGGTALEWRVPWARRGSDHPT